MNNYIKQVKFRVLGQYAQIGDTIYPTVLEGYLPFGDYDIRNNMIVRKDDLKGYEEWNNHNNGEISFDPKIIDTASYFPFENEYSSSDKVFKVGEVFTDHKKIFVTIHDQALELLVNGLGNKHIVKVYTNSYGLFFQSEPTLERVIKPSLFQ